MENIDKQIKCDQDARSMNESVRLFYLLRNFLKNEKNMEMEKKP